MPRVFTYPDAGGGGGGPDAFNFTDQTSVPISTDYTSNTVTLAGGSGSPWVVTVTGGTYSKNGGAFTALPGTAVATDTFAVKSTTSGSLNTTVNCTLAVGTTSDIYSTTTVVNTEASALILRITVDPGSTRRGLIDNLIGSLIASGAWAVRDCIYVLAAADAQSALLNWKGTGVVAAATAAATFTADRGYTGTGATSVNSGLADNTAAINWSQNSANVYVYINLAGTASTTAYIWGVISSNNLRFNPSDGSNLTSGRLHQAAGNQKTNAVRTGGYHQNRSSSNAVVQYGNGVQLGTSDTNTSTATVPDNLCALRSNGSFATDRAAIYCLGGSENSTIVAAEHAAFVTYLTAVGGA